MFTALAEGFGNLKEKLDIFIAVAPITNMYHATQKTLKDGTKKYGAYDLVLSKVYQFNGPNWENIRTMACLVFPCDLLNDLTNPAYAPYNDENVIKTIAVRRHAAASTKQLFHFMQSARDNNFA